MRKILLIGLGVVALTVLLSVLTASLMAAPLPSDVAVIPAVGVSHHLARLPDGTIGLLYYNYNSSGGDYYVLFTSSSDNGVTWSAADTLNASAYMLIKEPPDLTSDADGNLFAVWDASDGTRGEERTDIWFAYRDVSTGNWTVPEDIVSGPHEETGPRVALSPDRTVHVVYYDEDSLSTVGDVYYTRNITFRSPTRHAFSPAGAPPWSTPVDVDNTDDICQNPSIVADSFGRVHVFFGHAVNDGSGDTDSDRLEYVMSGDEGMTWSPTSVDVSQHPTGQSFFGIAMASAVAFPDSTVHVVWLDDSGTNGRDIYYATRDSAGEWSPPFNVTQTSTDASELFPTIAADAAGRINLVYEDKPAGSAHWNIYARHLDPGGAWTAATNLSQSVTADERGPGIVSDVGRAGYMAAWLERNAPNYRIVFRLSDDEIWPGDTNNDGTVDADDVMPLLAYWTTSGPARVDPGVVSWTIHPVATWPWSHWQAGFADANGDGVVDARDVLPIGLNWGQTHAVTGPAARPDLSKVDPAAFSAAAAQLRASLGGDGATGHAGEMVRAIDRALQEIGMPAGAAGAVSGVWPNPTGGATQIRYRLAAEGHVTVTIYDSRGRRVKTVLSASRPAGDGDVQWDGRDAHGAPAPAGVYMARIEAGGATTMEKILRVK